MAERNHKSNRYRKTPHWHWFDKLPTELRQALAGAAFPYDAKWFYDHLRKGQSVKWCIDRIKEGDKRHALQPEKIRDGFGWKVIPSAYRETGIGILYT